MYISSATTLNQRSVVATIEDLPAHVAKIRDTAPSLLIVGNVASLQQRIDWFPT
jgi:siroheme synthase